MFRIPILISMLLLGSVACRPKFSTPLQKAVHFLWEQQHEDGGWHSQTHGLMKGGEALTAYILWQLLQVPDNIYQKDPGKVEMGLEFIRHHLHEDGILGMSDPDLLDYPNYATSYALRCLSQYGEDSEDPSRVQKMQTYLSKQQFTEQRGIHKDHPAYGSWGFGEQLLQYGETGHIDLSHTRRVIEALRISNYSSDSLYLKAIHFLDQMQVDSGFHSSPTIHGSNKGGQKTDGNYRSYATATADGLLATFHAHQAIVPAVQNAKAWLLENPTLDTPAGIPEGQAIQWEKVLFFYHIAVRVQAYKILGLDGTWQEDVQLLLSPIQEADGSFSNPWGAPNKEDDPLLATTFAVIALLP